MYNAAGELIYYSSYNIPVVNNIQLPPVMLAIEKTAQSDNISDSYTDPSGMFGVYYSLSNVKTSYSKIPNGWDPIKENASLSANVEIGAQYYNFHHLLDNDQPRVTKRPFISTSVSSNYYNQYNPDRPPPIRIPGKQQPSNDMNGYPGYNINYTLLDKNYNKNSSYYQEESIGYNILNQSFFIGPVPCNIRVDMNGKVALTRSATMDTLTDGNVRMNTTITPRLELAVTGQGGVNASIAYAIIVTDVKVITADMPITLHAGIDPDINAQLKIAALSGRVYMKAGVCIPIPFCDDICKEFVMNIFDWTGPTSNNTLIR